MVVIFILKKRNQNAFQDTLLNGRVFAIADLIDMKSGISLSPNREFLEK